MSTCDTVDLDTVDQAQHQQAGEHARALLKRARTILAGTDTQAMEGARVQALSYAPRAYHPHSDRLQAIALELRNQRDRLNTTAACPRCGQTMIADATVCDPCRALEREPQGEPLPLFTMAPAVRAPQPEGLF